MVKLLIILILIAIASMTELSLAIPKQQFVYPLISTDEENSNSDNDDAEFIGQEIYKLMDDIIPSSLVDKRTDIPLDPCSCPYRTKYFQIDNLTTTIYLEGRVCNTKMIDKKKHNSFCDYRSCKESKYKITYFENDKKMSMEIPLDCRCLN
ncbi:hypothetical protein PVAND_012721 [Polypedilum vanderplanki]|uniref:Spaetzle domain-containing protein n=1 Tax=Polypedilum vanderplanki TaxID=319348 RepID=A0A9J6CNB5_POLVA|nr:hypothetical protein PVAND_012721 [Polypedilum vanderplanki]